MDAQLDPKKITRLFIKFTDEKYVDSIVNEGLLYMNNLEYFSNIEDEFVRGDKDDGLAASYDSRKIELSFAGQEITGLIGPVKIRYNHELETNVFSLTAITDFDFIRAGGSFRLSENFKNFGNKAVVFAGSAITSFLERVRNKLEHDPDITAGSDSYGARPVEYVSRAAHHGEMGIFRKYDEYAWQHEWRIAIKRKSGTGPYDRFKLGSLADICTVYDTEELLKHPFQVKYDI